MIYTDEKKITGIIYCTEPQPVTGRRFLKYRNIIAKERQIVAFCDFARKFPGAHYINFYGKKSKKYIGRMYLK